MRHRYGTRSSVSAVEAAAAAAGGGGEVQQGASSSIGRQPVQPVQGERCVDEGSGTEAADAPKAARKRKAALSMMQQPSSNSRPKNGSKCSPSAATAKEGCRGLHDCLDRGSPSAADGLSGAESDSMTLDGPPFAARRRRALRLRKGKVTGISC